MSSIMELLKPTPEEEARKFCHLAGWHHNGDTSAMLGNGGIVQLPEVMVAFYRYLIAENTHLRELLEESLKYRIKPLVAMTQAEKKATPELLQKIRQQFICKVDLPDFDEFLKQHEDLATPVELRTTKEEK